MPMRWCLRVGRAWSCERGASAVEFALVVPLLLMLVLGTISVGTIYDRQVTLSGAAREGARFGATLPTGRSGVGNSWLDDVANYAVSQAAGQLGSSMADRVLCVAYIGYGSPMSSTSDWTKTRRQTGSGTPTYASGSAGNPATWCFDDGLAGSPQHRRVQVTLQRTAELQVVAFTQSIGLRGEGVARFEAVAA